MHTRSTVNPKTATAKVPVKAAPAAKATASVKPTPTVKVAQATAAAQPTAAPAAAQAAQPTPKAPRVPKYASRDVIPHFGRKARVMEYQDWTFSVNARPDRRLTDEELAADWRGQFPLAVAFTPYHVAGARRDFNAGVHSKAFRRPETPTAQYVVVNGQRVEATAAPKAAPVKAAPVKPTASAKPAASTKHAA